MPHAGSLTRGNPSAGPFFVLDLLNSVSPESLPNASRVRFPECTFGAFFFFFFGQCTPKACLRKCFLAEYFGDPSSFSSCLVGNVIRPVMVDHRLHRYICACQARRFLRDFIASDGNPEEGKGNGVRDVKDADAVEGTAKRYRQVAHDLTLQYR